MRVVRVIVALLVVPVALAVLGTGLSSASYLGMATAYVPWCLPRLVMAAAAGDVLAARWLRERLRGS